MIDDWMPTLATTIAAVSPLKGVYTYLDLPGSLKGLPCGILLPERGINNYSAGGPRIFVHDVRLTVYVAGGHLPSAYAVAIPLIGDIRDALAAHTELSGIVDHVYPRSPFYEGPGEIRYGIASTGSDNIFLGFILNLEVKEHETFTVGV